VRPLRPPLARGPPGEGAHDVNEDVAAEEARMRELLQHRTGMAGGLAANEDSGSAVEVFGLQKVFPAGCCGGRGCAGVFW
jgi:hypothetical protein